MAHHSGQPSVDSEVLRRMGIGPTGQFPEGKLNEHDEGEIQIGVRHEAGTVVIEFGKPIAWMGCTPEQAREIAKTLEDQARKAEWKARGIDTDS